MSGSERLDPNPGVSLSTSGATSYDPDGGHDRLDVENSSLGEIVGRRPVPGDPMKPPEDRR